MIKIYTLKDKETWDTIVRSFALYDSYWLSGYVTAFWLHGDGEPILFLYEDDETRGINVVMKRDVADDSHFVGKLEKDKYFDFSSPYGYGGWLIEGDSTDRLFEEYEKWCGDNGIIAEFVRCHPVIENQSFLYGKYDIIPLGETITMDISSPEVIWSNLTSKNRNVIRKARKNGVEIYSARNAGIYEVFQEIYNGTMDKDNADSYYYFSKEFYESVLNDLPYNAQVFYAVWKGKIIAASIILATNGRMNYHLSGSLRDYAHLAPTNLLLYEAALWGSANGYKTLYLGGGVGSKEDSLFKFKKAFYRGENLKRFYIGRKILNLEMYDKLVKLRTNLAEGDFFPRYRA